MSGPRALTRYDTSLKAPRLSSKSPESSVSKRCTHHERRLVEDGGESGVARALS
jgi:hypothetical protein